MLRHASGHDLQKLTWYSNGNHFASLGPLILELSAEVWRFPFRGRNPYRPKFAFESGRRFQIENFEPEHKVTMPLCSSRSLLDAPSRSLASCGPSFATPLARLRALMVDARFGEQRRADIRFPILSLHEIPRRCWH